MTDNEIIEALEEAVEQKKAVCSSYDSALILTRETAERIIEAYKSQKAEIERINANYEKLQLKYENEVNDNKFLKRQNKNAKSEAIKDVILTLEAEVESNNKYLREYDNSEVQKAYNQGLKNAYNIVKEMEGVSK